MVYSFNENEVVTTESLTFKFDNAPHPVIDGLNLSLNRNEVLFLIGPSGMGKTTLLKILAGLYRPTGGEIYLEGTPLGKLKTSERRAALKRVGMTFQRSGLFDSMTVFENLLFPLRELTSLNIEEAQEWVRKNLHRVGLSDCESKYPFEISGGMQKRLGIARTLILEPNVVFYDDPTAGLDPITSKNIVDLILAVHREKGTATLISTSDLDLALGVSKRISARIVFLYQGKILESGTAKNILESTDPVVFQFTRGLMDGPLTKGLL